MSLNLTFWPQFECYLVWQHFVCSVTPCVYSPHLSSFLSVSLSASQTHLYLCRPSWLFFFSFWIYFIVLPVRVSVSVFYPTLPHPPLPHPDLISGHVAPPAGQQRGNTLFTGTWCPRTPTYDYFAVCYGGKFDRINRIDSLMLCVFMASILNHNESL